MAKPIFAQRRCIFCGSLKNITREHVVPDWLRRVIPRTAKHHSHYGTVLSFAPNTVFIQPSFKVSQGNAGTRKLFMVCKPCNNGWMRDVQDEIIPILSPLVAGRWEDFDPSSGEKIAFWMAMTATVIAMSYTTTKGVTEDDRRHIWLTKTIPPNWMIWVGRGTGFEDVAYSNRVAEMVVLSEDIVHKGEANAAVTTIALSQLLIHSINVPIGHLLPDPILYGADIGVYPIHRWGGDTLRWQWLPFIGRDSAQFTRLTDEFNLKVMVALAPV